MIRRGENSMRRRVLAMVLVAVVLPAGSSWAEDSAAEPAKTTDSAEELAKKTQNPVADLISVPFQNNFNFNTGPEDKTVWVMNVQPVIPIKLNDDWNLITRWIMPIIHQPSLAPGVDHASGLGDINPTFFLSPAGSEEVHLGRRARRSPSRRRAIGCSARASTARDRRSSRSPCRARGWPGALLNNQWSFAGWGDTRVNQFLIQPFVNYNFGKGWYLVSAPILTANWVASSGDQWTVPVGGGGGRLFRLKDLPGGDRLGKLGELPVNTQLQGFYNAIRPDETANWQLRLQIQLLFPK